MFESFLGVNPWTALFVLLNTLTIYFVARKYLFGPVSEIIESRQRDIDRLYSDAGAARTDAESLKAEYQLKLTDARAASERIVKEAVHRGQVREDEIIRKASAEAAAILDKATADIALEKKKAMNDARNEIAGLAMAIAGKVVGRELNAAEHSRLVDSFLDGLGDCP